MTTVPAWRSHEHFGGRIEQFLYIFGLFVDAFLPPPLPLLSPLLTQCDGLMGAWKTAWGLMARSQGLSAMLYCLGAGLSRWRPLDIPGTQRERLLRLLILFKEQLTV